MTRIEHSVTIQAPVEQVFSYAADFHKWPEWFEGVSEFTATTPVTQGNGARYSYKVSLMGVFVSVETEIRDFVQNRGWSGVATRGMPHRTYWNFESLGRDTKLTYALEYQLPVPLLGPLLDVMLMRPQWNKILQHSLNNLRQHFLTQASGSAH